MICVHTPTLPLYGPRFLLPGVVAELAGPRNRVERPQQLAGSRVEARTRPLVLLCVGTVAPSRIAEPMMITSLTMAGVEWTPISPVSRSICWSLP